MRPTAPRANAAVQIWARPITRGATKQASEKQSTQGRGDAASHLQAGAGGAGDGGLLPLVLLRRLGRRRLRREQPLASLPGHLLCSEGNCDPAANRTKSNGTRADQRGSGRE